MEHTIQLGAEEFVRMPCRIRARANTKLLFTSEDYCIDELQLTITDGNRKIRKSIKNGVFDLTQYATKACVIEIVLDLMLRGSVAKTWRLEPFVVMENGGKYVLIPEVELLRNEVRRMKRAIKELNAKIQETM